MKTEEAHAYQPEWKRIGTTFEFSWSATGLTITASRIREHDDNISCELHVTYQGHTVDLYASIPHVTSSARIEHARGGFHGDICGLISPGHAPTSSGRWPFHGIPSLRRAVIATAPIERGPTPRARGPAAPWHDTPGTALETNDRGFGTRGRMRC